ncbi:MULTISPECIES: sulfurtransferase [unclassified Undibacterium]|uniref:sulfurtransferase n=1 Tax=unclassified Undibacterium TaxID=2630295 RepID=UPI002AC9C4F2|nr:MULTISPECIES: sulfurtransferase [unclassified Undibacterium]MEB0139819.1 sulfurtransferase [Undibacterium sp. CCC2.1]MEB0170473.1 sulfurtransferase [Undibacterium sp. CCC1.1]MEB0174414.1 sulfurtransferase [Undibacterium sp. CCC3.4]MEB0213789.1 sulfurtransferase [Undibacterium sp. 5I2]WPX43951.1 sulfurtransferase [Undibacterium sp. CCC3.4]
MPAATLSRATPYVNISAYKFISFDDTAERRPAFLAKCSELNLKGTILLTPEGINMFLAGLRHEIDAYMDWLRSDVRFADIVAKESFSERQPFTKLLVKIKAEIITMRMPLIKPEEGRAPFVTAPTLKRWLDQGHDDQGRAVVMVDTRNDFEVDVGSFDNTIDYRISKFTEFPAVIEANREALNDKTVVTFCTGGIRCEKAAIHMQNIGYDSVYQLEGGILKYFEEVGGAHYHGDCFVFDYRTALNPQLEATDTKQCYACRAVVTPREQLSPWYIAGKSCPHCMKASSAAA